MEASDVADARANLIVTYGTRSEGQLGYILFNKATRETVFTSDYKSEVIQQSQVRKGFTPQDGSESTYARQIAAVAGEAVLTETLDLRHQLQLATVTALTEYLIPQPDTVIDPLLDQYTFAVEAVGDTAVRVVATATDSSAASFTFTLNISSKADTPNLAPDNIQPLQSI